MAAPPAQAHAMTVGLDTATVVGADDNDVSPHTGALPSTKGMRPCRHCQALQHPIRLKRHERSCLASQRLKHRWQHATSRCCFPDCEASPSALRRWSFFSICDDWTRGLLGCQVRNWLEVQGSFGVIKESIFGFLVLWRCNSVGPTGPCLI